MIEMSMPLSYHVCRAPAQRLLLAQLREEARQRYTPSDPAARANGRARLGRWWCRRQRY